MVLLVLLLFMFEQIEEETVIVMDSGCKFLHSEQGMHDDYFERNLQHILLLNYVSYD